MAGFGSRPAGRRSGGVIRSTRFRDWRYLQMLRSIAIRMRKSRNSYRMSKLHKYSPVIAWFNYKNWLGHKMWKYYWVAPVSLLVSVLGKLSPNALEPNPFAWS
jgi:hypothetical protein